MANIIIGVRFCTNKLQRIKFDNVELDGKAGGLKEKTSQQIGTPMDQIDLMYAGMILEDDQPLKSYGITPGVMVHVLKKRIKNQAPTKTYTEAEIMELAASIRTTIKKGFGFFLSKLTNADEIRTEVFAHLSPTCVDPVARAIALDPQLHAMLTSVTTLRQVIARHPDIVEVVRAMGTYLLKRQAELKAAHAQSGNGRHLAHGSVAGNRSTTSSTQTAAGGSARYGMFEDDDVDIEDVDADVDGDNDDDLPSPISGSSSGGGYALARNASYNAITAAQLANAIANATHLTSRYGPVGTPTTPRPILGSGGAAAPVITSEMFSGALQHAFSSLPTATTAAAAATAVAGASPVLPAPPPLGSSQATSQMSVDEPRVRFQQQLMQMREMGLQDEAANIRALQATMGNVQAAIDLVFNADIG